eukprot:4116660-Prymnesium_polylepis.1
MTRSVRIPAAGSPESGCSARRECRGHSRWRTEAVELAKLGQLACQDSAAALVAPLGLARPVVTPVDLVKTAESIFPSRHRPPCHQSATTSCRRRG